MLVGFHIVLISLYVALVVGFPGLLLGASVLCPLLAGRSVGNGHAYNAYDLQGCND